MERGTLKSWIPDRGFGFIARPGCSRDAFAHITEVLDELHVGDEVEFEVREHPKGPRAVGIRRRAEVASE